MDLQLTYKRVLVTGASRGIGRSIAEAFLKEGAVVTICARGEDGLKSALEELSSLGTAHGFICDMAKPDDIEQLVEDAARTMGGLDILISNVSAMSGKWRDCVEIDIMGAETLINASLKHMKPEDDANIVAIASRAASTGGPSMASYCAVKAATVSMIKSLGMQLAPSGMRANVVSPGDILFPGGFWEKVSKEHPKGFQAALDKNPTGRMGTPEEIADMVIFTASARASFVNGANLLVDGACSNGLQI